MAVVPLTSFHPLIEKTTQAQTLPTPNGLHDVQALQAQGDWAGALALGEQAMQSGPFDPRLAHVHGLNLGVSERHAEAAALWEQVIAVDPSHAEAMSNAGNAYLALNDLARARQHLRQALSLHPEHPSALYNAAVLATRERDWGWAQQCLETLLALQPQHTAAWRLLTQVAQAQWDFTAVYTTAERAREQGVQDPVLMQRQIATATYVEPPDPQRLFDAIGRWAASQRMTHCATPGTARVSRARGQRLRIGLVSANLCHHPVGLFVQGLLAAAAARSVDWVGYHNNPVSDSLTQRLRAHCTAWHSVASLDDAALAALIRSDHIDVLVDLSGHTLGNRLGVFAHRPATAQVSWLGYHATTGVAAMDAVLVDPVCVPESEAHWFTERVVRLPQTRLCMQPISDAPPISPLPALTRGHITFGSYQDLTKISDSTLALWADIARRVPTAVFRIQSRQWDQQGHASRVAERRFQAAGLPLSRCRWVGSMSTPDYLASYAEVDVVLDSFPFPSGTKTVQALWMGVPTLTLALPGMLGRQGQALLHAAGLADWVTTAPDAYVDLAVAWAQPQRWRGLATWRQQARSALAVSPLFDHEAFGRDWIAAVTALWRDKTSRPQVGVGGHDIPRVAPVCATPVAAPRQAAPATDQASFEPRNERLTAMSEQLQAVLDAHSSGQPTQALALAHDATQRWPEQALTHNMLGWVFDRQGQPDDAAAAWSAAVALAPNFASALSNLGLHFKNKGQWQMAEHYLKRAVAVQATHYNAQFNLGQTYAEQGLLTKAVSQFERALAIEPDRVQARYSLGRMAQRQYRFAQACEQFSAVLQREPRHISAWCELMFSLHYRSDAHPKVALQAARQWAAAMEPSVPRCRSAVATSANKRLTVGLVSADLRDHSVTHFLMALLNSNAATQIDWVAYANSEVFDGVSEAIASQARAWRPIRGVSDAQVCEWVQADGVDVLVDLAGVTAGHRIGVFARKPAPVQISWLGYFSTMGLSTMDAVLADPVCVPVGEERWFTERVWRLPHTRLCMAAPLAATEVVPTPALTQGHITYGSFQDMAKITDEVLATWARIARAVATARFRIQVRFLDAEPDKRARFEARLEAAGLPLSRVSLHSNTPFRDYFAAHGEVDVLLDTFPYPGGTTTAQAIWMGVPTISLARPGMLARQGAGLLSAAGLTDWVVSTPDAYVAKAVAWAQPQHWFELNALRLGLREQARRSPLFDGQQFGRDWVDVVRAIWRQACGLSDASEAAVSWRAHFRQAMALRDQGHAAAAVERIDGLLRDHPRQVELLNAKAVLMEETQQEEAWAQAVQALLNHAQHDAAAVINAARWQQRHGQLPQARALLSQRLQADPHNAQLMLTLAPVLRQLGDHSGAREMLAQAIEHQPDNATAHFKLGVWCEDVGDYPGALKAYETALDLQPAHRAAMNNRMMVAFRLADFDAFDHAQAARRRAAAWVQAVPAWPHRSAPQGPQRRLRVGVLSADLGEHPVGYFFQALLCSEAAAHADWIAYSGLRWDDGLHLQLRQRCEAWHDSGHWSTEVLCQRIADDRIDVLLDLSGYTQGGRADVLARRVAPLQVSWLGYFATTGLSTVDAVMADPVCVPEHEERAFVEKVWRLPHTRLCMPPLANAPDVAPTPALVQGHITVGCYQDLAKINDAVLQVWGQLAVAEPTLRFRVQSAKLREDTPLRQDFLRRLALHGIAPHCVQLLGPMSMARYLASYAEVDFCLDTWPYTGGTTTVQALWMGVPTLSLATPGMLGRQGESLLRAVGLDDWVVTSSEAMVQCARAWCNSDRWPALQAQRQGLRDKLLTSPLLDTVGFGHDWMRTLRAAWQHACLQSADGWQPDDLPAVLAVAQDLADHGQWLACAALLEPLATCDAVGASWRRLYAVALAQSRDGSAPAQA